MQPAIPASAIVNVIPGVVSAGGTALNLSGLLLTSSSRIPIGAVLSFATAAAVGTYFGLNSSEYAAAQTYFAGYDNSFVKPAALLMAQYPTGSVAGYLRGGPVTLAQAQAVTSGTLTIIADGVSKTSSALNLSGATSLSNAAALILAAFTSPGFSITYDSISGGFLVTSNTTGASSSVAFATGTPAASLMLTAATGAVTSAGSVAATPAAFMTSLIASNQNFATFSTLFEPNTSDKVAFAAWNNGQGNRYAYIMWDTSSAPTVVPDTSSAGYLIAQGAYSGTCCIYTPNTFNVAAFVMGSIASLDFTRQNGRATMAFRSQSGLAAEVTSGSIAANLITNGYNFYGAYSTAAQGFNFLYPGSVSGPFAFLDTYVNEINLNAALQLALLSLLTGVGSVPYNQAGYSLISQACSGPINDAVNFGSIRAGVTLSATQVAQINAAAGRDVASIVQTRGWYLLIQDAAPATRAARGSPPITLWYTDGQSVQKITLSSLEVQ